MTFANPTGEALEIANTNWLLMQQLAKAGGLAETAINLLGEATGCTCPEGCGCTCGR